MHILGSVVRVSPVWIHLPGTSGYRKKWEEHEPQTAFVIVWLWVHCEYSGSVLRPATTGVAGFCDDGQGPISVLCGSWYVLSVMVFMDAGCAKGWLYTQSTNLSFVYLLKHRETSQTPTLCMPVKSWDSGAVLPPCYCVWAAYEASANVAPSRTQSICGMQKFYKFPYRLKWIVISGGGSGGGSSVCIASGIVAEARGSGVNFPFLPLCGS